MSKEAKCIEVGQSQSVMSAQVFEGLKSHLFCRNRIAELLEKTGLSLIGESRDCRIERIEIFVQAKGMHLLAAFGDDFPKDVPKLPPSLRRSAKRPTAEPRSSRGI